MLHPALPTRHFSEGIVIELMRREPPPQVAMDSPARLVMTDLADIAPLTVAPHERLALAQPRMVQQGTDVLFVVAHRPHVLGLLTLADLQGEKPLRVVAERRLTHEDLHVADVMQPLAQLNALDHRLLRLATVGQVVATLLESGHTHLLIVEPGAGAAAPQVRGVVSQMQLERQLGVQLPSSRIATTFAEIEQALL